MIGRIRDGASHVTEEVRSTAQAVAARAADTARDLGNTVRNEAGRVIDAQRGRAASKVRKVGSAVDKAARLLRAGRIDGLADYVDMAARTAEHASDYLEDRALDQMLDDLGDLAKRHPVAIFGGLLAAGFAAGRVAKILQESADSVEDQDEQSEEHEDEDDGDRDDEEVDDDDVDDDVDEDDANEENE